MKARVVMYSEEGVGFWYVLQIANQSGRVYECRLEDLKLSASGSTDWAELGPEHKESPPDLWKGSFGI